MIYKGTSDKAINEWLKTHNKGEGFEPVYGCRYKGLPMVLFHNEQSAMPWSVQYAGSGRYFETREQAEEYIEGRTHRKKQRSLSKEQPREHRATMTAEEKRARHADYQRAWAKRNPDRIKQYRLNAMRRAAIAAILAEREKTAQSEPPKEGFE